METTEFCHLAFQCSTASEVQCTDLQNKTHYISKIIRVRRESDVGLLLVSAVIYEQLCVALQTRNKCLKFQITRISKRKGNYRTTLKLHSMFTN